MARVKIYTRGGDHGDTALGDGRRVSKADQRVDAYGAVDELNSILGVALASQPADELVAPLQRIQAELFSLGAALCNPESVEPDYVGPNVDSARIADLEAEIDRLDADLAPLKNFILPGGHLVAACLQTARTICRRAERLAVALTDAEPLPDQIIPYLNRLSDLLFVMARFQNKAAGVIEPIWKGK